MKKLVTLFLALTLISSMIVLPAHAELEPMTTEEITLIYGTWDTAEEDYKGVVERSIAAFEAAYPNITVEVMNMSTGTLYSDLQNMATAGTMPDLYLTTEVPRVVTNGWALDVTKYLDNDPEAADLMQSYRKVAQIQGRDFAIPAYTYPYIVIINATMVEKYNLEMPSADWTFDEYIELAEALAHYEDYNFGNGGHLPYRWYTALMEGTSSYGWDGTSYNFTDAWVESIQMVADWRSDHIWEGFDSEEEKIAAVGAADVWIPGTGIIGLFTDYSWAAKQFLSAFLTRKTGQTFMIYPQPLGETQNAMAAVDFCVISPSCEYPREAYELSKWVIWGEQACMERVAYSTENSISYIGRQPVITTQSVWDAYAEHHNDKIKLFDSVREYIAEAHYVAPMYLELDAWIAENGIIGGIQSGTIDGYAILEELNEVAQDMLDEYYDNLILD